MEVDRPVVRRRVPPARLAAVPGGPRHRPRGMVDQPPARPRPRHPRRRRPPREVPRQPHLVPHAHDGRLELAVEVIDGDARLHPRGHRQHADLERRHPVRERSGFRRDRTITSPPRPELGHRERQRPRTPIEHGTHPRPTMRHGRHRKPDHRVPDPAREPPLRVELEHESTHRHQALRHIEHERRPDKDLQRDDRVPGKIDRRLRHPERPSPERLMPPLEASRREVLVARRLDDPRPVRVRIRRDRARQPSPYLPPRPRRRHLERDALPAAHRQPVRVPRERHLALPCKLPAVTAHAFVPRLSAPDTRVRPVDTPTQGTLVRRTRSRLT